MEILFIILGLFVLVVIIVVVQANRKAEYARNVYLEFEKSSDGRQLKFIMKHSDEQLRLNMMSMQIEILKRGYGSDAAPSDAAFAMVGALDEMHKEYENAR